MDKNEPPVPSMSDILSQRAPTPSNGSSSPGGDAQMSFEDAIGEHPDLQTLLAEVKVAFEKMTLENETMTKAATANLVVSGGPERLARANLEFARYADKAMNLLGDEKDPIRIEILRTIYQDISPYWQSLFVQTHMGRASVMKPEHIHEMLLGEAFALIDRIRSRGR